MKGHKHSHHKPYRGPWPEEHPSIPGRAIPAKGRPSNTAQPHGAPQSPIHKIPPQASKPGG